MDSRPDQIVDSGEFLAITVPEEAMAFRDSDCRNDRVRLIEGTKNIAKQVHLAHHMNGIVDSHWWNCPWMSCREARQLVESCGEPTHAEEQSNGAPDNPTDEHRNSQPDPA